MGSSQHPAGEGPAGRRALLPPLVVLVPPRTEPSRGRLREHILQPNIDPKKAPRGLFKAKHFSFALTPHVRRDKPPEGCEN